MPGRKQSEVKYRVNRRGEVVQAEVQPLPPPEAVAPPEGPTPREAHRLNTLQQLAEQGSNRRKAALMRRLDQRREERKEERAQAIAKAAESAGDSEEHVTFDRLRAGDIVVPVEYQRRLNQDRAIGYALKFSWRAFQAISVDRHLRDDGMEEVTLTDGQHRLYAAQLCFGDEKLVPCLITDLPNVPQRAALFITLNDERVGLNYNAKFEARLAALDHNAQRLVDLLASFGLGYTRPGENRGAWGKVTAVSTLEGMVRQGGLSSARETLSILKELWGDNPDAYRDFLLAGMWQFVVRYDGLYRRKRLLDALKRDGLEKVTASVSDFKSSINSSDAAAACGAIHFSYNWHLGIKDALPPFANEAKNRYSALIRRAARNWIIRHEGKAAPAVLAAKPVTGLYAPGNQVPSAMYRRGASMPGQD